jgi:1,4-dihydroxy-2-naphthoate polyprenyltransferase
METIQENSLKAWFSAVRPKTLAASIVPVMVGWALAEHVSSFDEIPALLCLIFALLAQIASNFSNDYFDFIKKTDNEHRLGPARAVASGWIKPKTMLLATGLVVVFACLAGLGLIRYGGLSMIWVGLACVVALFAYTAGPFPLAYRGLGDVFVFVFFGLVSVVFTYYVQLHRFEPLVFVAGAIVGFQQVNILVVNNYRDRENDAACNKRTSIVVFGEKFGRYFYLLNGIFACLLCLLFYIQSPWAALLPWLFLIPHIRSWRKLCRIREGRALNALLGETSRNLLILGTLFALGLLIE